MKAKTFFSEKFGARKDLVALWQAGSKQTAFRWFVAGALTIIALVALQPIGIAGVALGAIAMWYVQAIYNKKASKEDKNILTASETKEDSFFLLAGVALVAMFGTVIFSVVIGKTAVVFTVIGATLFLLDQKFALREKVTTWLKTGATVISEISPPVETVDGEVVGDATPVMVSETFGQRQQKGNGVF